MKIQGSKLGLIISQLEETIQEENIDNQVKKEISSHIEYIQTVLKNYEGPDLLSKTKKGEKMTKEEWKEKIREVFGPIFKEIPTLQTLPIVRYGVVLYGKHCDTPIQAEFIENHNILEWGSTFKYTKHFESWGVFKDPEEVYDKVDSLINSPELAPSFREIAPLLEGIFLCKLHSPMIENGAVLLLQREEDDTIGFRKK